MPRADCRRRIPFFLLAPLLATAAAGADFPVATASAQAEALIDDASIAELAAAMAESRATSLDLVQAYLARIAAVDDEGPRLNAVVELNPEAAAIAAALDEEREARGARGPLHGVPILLKENIDTADRMQTTAGSLALVGSIPLRDAFIVERLRQAGAVILGKTNLSEWANFRSTRSTSGWSARGGQTRNPHVLDRNPSGSSSGSGAAVAASLAAAAVGTETDGSILSPSSHCGIVGIKPTVGLLSRSGIIPIAHSQDTPGPMARSVADAAILLQAMTGADERDAATKESSAHAEDYTRRLTRGGLDGARLGVVRAEAFGFPAKTTPVLESALAAMRAAGAVLVEVELPHAGETDSCELDVLLYEFKADLAAYLEGRPGVAVKTLDDLIAFNRTHQDKELVHFGQELVERAAKMGPLSDKGYRKARERCRELAGKKGIDAALAKDRLAALVALSNGPAHLTDHVNGDAFSGGSSSPAAVAGYPAITVPAGSVHGLPIGVTFFASAWQEGLLIHLAHDFEQATRARRKPAYRATVAVDEGGR